MATFQIKKIHRIFGDIRRGIKTTPILLQHVLWGRPYTLQIIIGKGKG